MVGIIAVCWQRPLIIACSAFVGAYTLFLGIDMFANTGFADAVELMIKGEPLPPLETDTILMLVFSAVTCLVGVAVQFRSSRDYDHRQKETDVVYIKINS